MGVSTIRGRLAAAVLLVGVLVGLFLWAGTITPAADDRSFPDGDEVGPTPEAYVGERVSLSGTVVATDPAVVEVEYGVDGTRTVTVTGVGATVDRGDSLRAFGTLTDGSTLSADRTVVREPWELRYMYGVSFLAGLWVLGRTLRRWRVDADRLAFVPRASTEDRDA